MTKTETNVRGSPNPWVTSTKLSHQVTFIIIRGYNLCNNTLLPFSNLLTYSPSDSISKLVTNLAGKYINCSIIKTRSAGFPTFQML